MDRIHKELDEVKLEAEKLRDECRAKTELYHSLKKAQAEQLAKSRQDTLEIDKLSRELNAKSDEISEIRQMYEELQLSLQRKDLFLQQISSSNEKLRLEHSDKISKLESENRDLVSSLDEASSRIRDLEEKTRASSDEIAALKRLLSVKTERDFHEEVQKNTSKDLKQRDDYILKLEEENRVFQDKLKWKNEQFFHLEEAHGQLRAQFETSKTEWEKEKTSFIDEISRLQANLDAEVRISENLETQLRLSNRALASEESQRKVVEVELSESRARFENVVLECQVAKSEIEELTVKRDEEIAELRMLLREKERVENEMNYKTEQLERENNELLVSLKDIQKAQINSNATLSSLKKLQSKLEGLEKLHSKCGVNIKEKENKWNSEREAFSMALKNCEFELDCKSKCIRQLHEEVEVKNEEISVLIMVLKSEFYVAYSKLKMGFSQIEEKNMVLNQQLQKKNDELQNVHDERAVLIEQVAYLDSLRQKNDLAEDELRRYKAMLHESNEYKKQLLESEKALEMVNIELANRISDVEKLKSDAEIMMLNLEENRKAFELEKVSLLAIINDETDKIGKLQERVCQLESVILAKSEAADSYIQLSEDRQNEIDELKNKLAEKETATIVLLDAQNTLEQENKKFLLNIKEKDQRIQKLKSDAEIMKLNFEENRKAFELEKVSLLAIVNDGKDKIGKLQERVCQLESVILAKSEAADNYIQLSEDRQNEIDELKNELAEKEAANIVLLDAQSTLEQENNKFLLNIKEKDQRIQESQKDFEEKNRIIVKLEKEVNCLLDELEFQGKLNVQSKQEALQFEASLQRKISEIQELKSRLVEHESDKRAFLEDLRKLSIDKENLLARLDGICGKIGVLCEEDVGLVGMLGKMLYVSEENGEPERNILSSDGLDDIISFSPSRKLMQVTVDERAPLTELNC